MFMYNFTKGQVILAEGEMDIYYMLSELREAYENWRLTVNVNETKYMIVGERRQSSLTLGSYKIKNRKRYKYLGENISADRGSND